MYRSTKGASKARRDQINAEIRNLKELLPISDADKARLSYLHIMSLACMYTRKSVFFSQEMAITARHEDSGNGSLLSLGELSEVLNALPGFLLLISSEGKLLYLSDNVAEHLGHSMVDLVAQSDSVYDIVDPNDHFVLRNTLVPTTAVDSDRLFRCRFNTSKFIRRQGAGSKLTLVRARCLSLPTSASSYWSSNPVWMCSCSPVEPRTPYPATPKNPLLTPPSDQSFFLACFHSRHARDMKFLEAHDSVSVYLGYDIETLRSRSWYSLLHPRDLSHASAKHCSLLRETGERRVEMVVQVEAVGGVWVWLYMVMQLETGDQPISCLNYVISEAEAWSVRQQLCLEENQLALYLSASSGGGAPYPEPLALSCCPSEPLSSPDQVFTPSSSGLSGQSFDFSLPTSSQSSSDELGSAGPPDTHLLHQQHHQHHHHHQNLQNPPTQQPLFPQESLTLLGQRSGPTGPLHARLQASAVSSSPNRPHLHMRTSLPPLAMPQPPHPPPPQQKGEFVCTPPYTPRFGGTGNFLFGDEQFGFDPSSTTAASANPLTGALVPSATPGTTCAQPLNTVSQLGLPMPLTEAAARHKSRYGNLPLVPNMTDPVVEYATMALPEIRGPLYVDVPHGHYHPALPEGLLTPDASPTKQSSFPPAFFPQGVRQTASEEMERLEISLLAQYISAVAEGFYDNPLHLKEAPLSDPRPQPHLRPHLNLCPQNHPVPPCQPPQSEPMPACGLFPANTWATAIDCQPVSQDISLFEESIVVDLSPKNTPSPLHPPTSSSSPSSSSSFSPIQSSPPAPESWSSPCQSQGTLSPIGEYHFSSVQSARPNHPVGGGLLGASSLLEEEEAVGVSLCGMDVDMEEVEAMLPTSQSSSNIPSSPESVLPSPPPIVAAVTAAPAPGASCAQSLLEELVSMETMFGADALMASDVGQHPELYQLHPHHPTLHGLYPDGASDHSL